MKIEYTIYKDIERKKNTIDKMGYLNSIN